MCGIAGYLNLDGSPAPRERIEPMLLCLRHRGPDGFGVYVGPECVIGHARLSIIDIAGGWQPIFNEAGNLAITFNGEIYNYVELRRDLEALGHAFYTNSDTEVIVHAFEEWGRGCVTKFNGQFAFAVYDAASRSMFLGRDRLGVRPLYYALSGSRLVFGSEVKALLASGFVEPELSPDGIDQIYSLWTNVFPKTPFRGVSELPPAHTMIVSRRGVSLERYWRIPAGKQERISPDDAVEGVLEHLNRSIRLRLRADVPVGAYLSGGLDSALTTALIRKWSGAPLKTFSLRFTDPRFDESRYQEELVRSLGTEHASILCRPVDIVENLERVIRATERPILRTAPVPMCLLSQLVRSEGYKVVITGEGADEFFLGYDIFKEAKVRAFCARVPASRIRPALLGRLYPYLFHDARTAKFQQAFFLKNFRDTADPFYGHRIRWGQTQRVRDFYAPAFAREIETVPEEALLGNLPPDFRSLSPVERTELAEIETLLSSYLLSSQGDRVGMANSVEGRFVFLDHELVEFACRISDAVRMPGLSEKSILKRIGSRLLPPSILERKKFPYRAPDVDSFLADRRGRDTLAHWLEPGAIDRAGIFDSRKVGELAQRVLAAPGGRVSTSDNLVLMAILSGQMFFRSFFETREKGLRFANSDCVRRAISGEGKCLQIT